MQPHIAPTGNVIAFLLKGKPMNIQKPQPTCPRVGDRMTLKLDWVQMEDDAGVPRTPMAKIRFNMKTWEWEQVPIMEAGMLVFFSNTVPDTFHRAFTISSIVPNGRACYAEPE